MTTNTKSWHRALMAEQVLPETRALINAMTVKPNAIRTRLINTTIRNLKNFNLWDAMDVLYVHSAHDEQAARLNWKQPGTFTCTAVNSPTFTVDRGFKSNGTSSYLNTNFNPSTFGGTFQRNSAHIGYFYRDYYSANGRDVGYVTSNDIGITVRNPGSSNLDEILRLNSATDILHNITNNLYGHLCVTRVASSGINSVIPYENGSQFLTAKDGGASVALPNDTIAICRGAALYSGHQISITHLGRSLTSTEVNNLYGFLRNYNTGVGL